jgi:DNA-binding protein YbaB
VAALFDGTGQLLAFKVKDKTVVDPEDVELLEDLIVGIVRDGFAQATALRDNKVQGILPNVPEIPGL